MDRGTDVGSPSPRFLLAERLRAALDEHLSDPRSPFVRLRELDRGARRRSVALRDEGVDPPSARPCDRWARDLRALLFDPAPDVDTRVLSLAIAANPSAQCALRLPAEDVRRTALRIVPLGTLQHDGTMDVAAVNRLAEEHVDRCLAFLSLLEVDTPQGRKRLYAVTPTQDGARLYLLVSAAYHRFGPSAFAGGGAIWFAGLDDEALAGALSDRYESLNDARKAMCDGLAIELQTVVAGRRR